MPKVIVRFADIPKSVGGIAFGIQARDYVASQLDEAFDQAKASEFNPLKVVVDFEGVEDIGLLVVHTLMTKIDEVYGQDLWWYVAFSGIEGSTALSNELGSLLKQRKRSIVCESGPTTFCGVTAQDLISRGSPYRTEDWRGMAAAINFLYDLGENKFAPTADLAELHSALGYGKQKSRGLLNRLDTDGLILQRLVPRSNRLEWAHIARFNPED